MEVKFVTGAKYVLTNEERSLLIRAKSVLTDLENELIRADRLGTLMDKVDKASLSDLLTAVLRYDGVPLYN